VNEVLARCSARLFGDPRSCSFEQRLFNTISLLNAAANLVGAMRFLEEGRLFILFLLHLGSGVLFLLIYWWSRVRGAYRRLYWPFVVLLAVFLFVNVLENAGSLGGAHYYLIPAGAIAVILSRRVWDTVAAVVLLTATAAALLLIEQQRPEWVTPHVSDDRFADLTMNLIFAQVFTAVLVMVLAHNLQQERRKSEGLLLNVLPEQIAEELKRTDRVEPRQYDASVLFTDFVGFTQIAETMSPQELIEELDACFRQFDRIMKRHRLEKIKTIGDAYMAAGGLPTANNTHAVDCVLAALEILAFMEGRAKERANQRKPQWRIRVGVHSGTLLAGVIGREKFAYDVWGETVNIASRMESSGAAGCVNISCGTYHRVKDVFVCDHRGKVAAKNLGEIDMFFVLGLRPT
jgi:adenylate cyclase